MARAKKEFNKEAMYKKIMPSMLRGNDENNEEIADADTSSVSEQNNIEYNESKELTSNEIHLDEDKSLIDKDIEIKKAITKSYDEIDDEKITVNFIEILVREKLPIVLGKFKCCKCQSCINDIISIALNNLPVFYFSGNKKEIREALEEYKLSNNIDIVTEIIKAIIVVRKKENH